jgi:Ni/Co efflux regulator RcnB
MKHLLLVTTSLMLIIPDIALAQDQDQHHRPPGATRPAPAPGPQIRPVHPGGPNSGHKPPPRPQPQPPRPGGPSILPIRPPGGGHDRPPPRTQPQPQPRPPRPQPPHRPGTGRPPNFRPIHGPSYRYPHGYRYRRWTIGLFLPSIFLSSSYYYDDWAPLGVGAPPPGYRWVRYGPDLLLVQRRTGRIVDVIYGAFY